MPLQNKLSPSILEVHVYANFKFHCNVLASPANHSITNSVITILLKCIFKTTSLRCVAKDVTSSLISRHKYYAGNTANFLPLSQWIFVLWIWIYFCIWTAYLPAIKHGKTEPLRMYLRMAPRVVQLDMGYNWLVILVLLYTGPYTDRRKPLYTAEQFL